MINRHDTLSGKRCLVLDDEFLIALDIQSILEAAGATVVSVSTAEGALAGLRDNAPFDLAILDLKLSGATKTSVEVAERLAGAGTPFVFLTGMRADDGDCKRYPHVPVVEKPYVAEILIEAVRKVLARD